MDNETKPKNSFIKEAVIDIQIDESKRPFVSDIKSIVNKIPGSNIRQDELYEFNVQPVVNQVSNVNFQQDAKHVGYKFEDSNSGYIIQIKTSGIGISRLPPYTSWEDFVEYSKNLWSIYKGVLPPNFKFNRLAVRYINELLLPINEEKKSIDFDDYLVNGPKLPKDLGSDEVAGFFIRTIIPWRSPTASIVMTQTLQNITNLQASVVLDNDIFSSYVTEFSEAEMWNFFDELRTVKNKVFWGSITEKTKELIK